MFNKAIALWALLVHNKAMLAKVCSAAVNGIEAYPVEVEVNEFPSRTKAV